MGDVAYVYHTALSFTGLITAISCMGWGLRYFVTSSLLNMLLAVTSHSLTICCLVLLTLIWTHRYASINRRIRHLAIFTPRKARLHVFIVVLATPMSTASQKCMVHFWESEYDISVSFGHQDIGVLIFLIIVVVFVTLMTVNILLAMSLYPYIKFKRADCRRRAVPRATTLSIREAVVTLILCFSSFFTFTPEIITLALDFAGYKPSANLTHIAFAFAQSNCIVNPFVYLVMNRKFRRVARKSFVENPGKYYLYYFNLRKIGGTWKNEAIRAE